MTKLPALTAPSSAHGSALKGEIVFVRPVMKTEKERLDFTEQKQRDVLKSKGLCALFILVLLVQPLLSDLCDLF